MSRVSDKYQKVVDSIKSIIGNSHLESLSGNDIATFVGKFDIEDLSEVVVETNIGDGGATYHLKDTQLLHRKSGPAIVDCSGYERWCQYGALHRLDGPAVITQDARMYFNKGKLHRADGPAVEVCGQDPCLKYSCWFKDGVANRDGDLPCLEFDDGTKVYMRNGHIHRSRGPAIILPGNVEIWMWHGHIHNHMDGEPAIIDGETKLYYRRGIPLERPKIMTVKAKNQSDADRNLSVANIMADRLGGSVIQCDEQLYCIEDVSGNRTWYMAGTTTKHREDAPAVELVNGTKIYYNNGLIHRDGGPAIVKAGGEERYYFQGKLHSPNSATPAIQLSCGTECYFKHGAWHRDGDLPAARLMEESGSYSLIWARDGKLHRDDLSQAAIQWGPNEWLLQSSIDVLKSSPPLPGLSNPYGLWHQLKPTNLYEFYKDGKKIADAPYNNSEMIQMRMLSIGGLVVSASGTAKITGDLSPVGLVGAEITGGTLNLRSTGDILLSGCILNNTIVVIDSGLENSRIIKQVTNNYLVNSKIIVRDAVSLNNMLDERSVLVDNLDGDAGSVRDEFYLPDPNDEIMLRKKKYADNRAARAHAAAHDLEEPFLTPAEVDQGIRQLELQFGEDHLSTEERAANAVQILNESFSKYIGESPKDIDLDNVKKRVASILDVPDSEVGVDIDSNTMNVSVTITPVAPLQFVTVPENHIGSTNGCIGDDCSWKTVLGALGAAALMSYLARKSKASHCSDKVDSEKELINATF